MIEFPFNLRFNENCLINLVNLIKVNIEHQANISCLHIDIYNPCSRYWYVHMGYLDIYMQIEMNYLSKALSLAHLNFKANCFGASCQLQRWR